MQHESWCNTMHASCCGPENAECDCPVGGVYLTREQYERLPEWLRRQLDRQKARL